MPTLSAKNMARKRSHILQKVSSKLLRIPIFIAKLRKPIIPRLISLKKSSKLVMKNKFKIVNQYNYGGYIQEYQFSPSATPLIPFYKRKQLRKRSNLRDLYSILFLLCSSTCFGGLKDDNGSYNYPLEFEAFPAGIEVTMANTELIELSDSAWEDDSVDERAERFIERFYEEMRKQRRESFPQLMNGLLEN